MLLLFIHCSFDLLLTTDREKESREESLLGCMSILLKVLCQPHSCPDQ